ncbi:methyltransferase family protein [Aliiruegeria haliotis]|uniref:Methyltransferase family protein n=1 Tax=Aliiruegeria haliotis TaxID=1280846 RepID=A0A2T0RGU9_9RHOB|nr:class I SAM-dependent methyltransferase [Aliiruegeria haliotis]PRY20436.1 methyltransferase family protein [Aliiruegeria haliotis]
MTGRVFGQGPSAYDAAASWWSERLSVLKYPEAYSGLCHTALNGHLLSRVVDIGTGGGDLARAAIGACPSIETLHLVDTSARMLEAAQAALRSVDGPDVTVEQTDMELLQPCRSFDIALAGHVIEHASDPVLALRQLAGLVRPGGVLLLVVSRPHICQFPIWLRWRHRWFSETQMRRMTKEAMLGAVDCMPLAAGVPARTSRGYLIAVP